MPFNLVVPPLSESVLEATVSEWLKQVGDTVAAGEVVVTLETDKVALEVTADVAGVLTSILHPAGDDVRAGEVLAVLDESSVSVSVAAQAVSPATAAAVPAEASPVSRAGNDKPGATPVARRVAEAENVDITRVPASDGSKVRKADVQGFVAGQKMATVAAAPPAVTAPAAVPVDRGAREERIRMTRRRRTIATRLLEAKQATAMLTTFNEIDMGAVQALRQRHKDSFKEKYGVSLGLSSFFVKAAIGALKLFPMVNAEIDGNEIILKHYYDIGVAIGASEGLVVPVLRDADRLSFAEIEKQIRTYAQQVEDSSLPIEALLGGTFTITNGGVFGSLMSTPILNYPQVGILGLHAIKDRPVVVKGEIVVRPMMYVALSYDHRIIDGREAVQFLVKVKDLIEDPERLLIEG